MGNDQRFLVPNLTTEEQQLTVKNLGVIVNVIGMKVIEVVQKDPRFKSCQGVMICRFSKKITPSMAPEQEPRDDYKYWIEGGQLSFIPNPYGAGNVVFLVDDDEPVPRGSKSGAEKGYNRDFLASHYSDKLFKIVDPEIDAEVRGRYENIIKKLEEERPVREAQTARVIEASKIEENKRKGVQSIHIVGQPSGPLALAPAMPGSAPQPGVATMPPVDEEKERLKKENEELRKQLAGQGGKTGQKPAPASEDKPAPEKKKPGRPAKDDKAKGAFAS